MPPMPRPAVNSTAPEVATVALALIGLLKAFGTCVAGSLGQRPPKRDTLSAIHGLRPVPAS